jgi:MFS family permease
MRTASPDRSALPGSSGRHPAARIQFDLYDGFTGSKHHRDRVWVFHHHYVMVETPLRWREVFAGERGKLTAGILLVEFLVAVEALVVVAIMPAVRHDLGGLQYYGLAFTGFSLAAVVASPLAGRAADRGGPDGPFIAFAAVFMMGTLLCGLVPSMPLLVLARIVQGLGAGGAYTVALAAVTRSYSDSGRAQVLALLAGAWIVPGLLGPSYGALVASTAGWRWAFFSIIPPILLAMALALPGLRALQPPPARAETLSLRWPFQLAVGLAAALAGASFPSIFTLPLLVIGAALAINALVAILPTGSLRAAAGMPAGIVIIFFLIFAFIGTEYFLPLMVTTIRGRSLAEAGIIVTLGTVSWSASNWWQARVVNRFSSVALVRLGALILTLGIAGILLMLADAPLLISYLAWLLAGVGMGIAYPTAYLVIMRGAATGGEGAAVSSQQVAERLALALGGGFGGGCIALALALHASLIAGLAGALALTLISSLAALALSPRLGRG